MHAIGFDTGSEPERAQRPRRSRRVALAAEVTLRRTGQSTYRVNLYDLSPDGCKLEFVERPSLDERVWVKFEGLEALEALVCWTSGFLAGVEFERAIHPAVFQALIARLAKA